MKRFLSILLFWLLCCGFSQGWQKPPLGTQLNRSHPLSQKMPLYLPINENSGSVLNNLGGSFNGRLFDNVSWAGNGLSVTGAAVNKKSIGFPGYSIVTPSTGFSITVILKRGGNGVSGTIIDKYNVVANLEWILYFSSTNKLYWYVYDQSATAYIGRFVNWTRLDTVILSAIYRGGTALSSIEIWCNGVRIDTDNFSAGGFVAIENLSSPVQIAGYVASATSNGLVGKIELVAIHYYPLSIPQIQYFHREPWGVLTTPMMARPYLNFGGGTASNPSGGGQRRRILQISWWEQIMKNLGLG